MKKYFLLLIGLFSFIGINSVKADTTDITLDKYYSYYDSYISDISNNSSVYDSLIEYYNQNYASLYPYYIITTNYFDSYIPYNLLMFSTSFNLDIVYFQTSYQGTLNDTVSFKLPTNSYYLYYNTNSATFSFSSLSNTKYDIYSGPTVRVSRNIIVSSNMSLNINSITNMNNEILDYSFTFPTFRPSNSDEYFQPFTITTGYTFPTYSELSDGSYTPSIYYTEIDLNDYSYVALSLKNYNVQPFETTFMAIGQVCLTPVYNYGMTQKTEFYSGYTIDRCSPAYSTFTPYRVSILQQDITNHAIYYLKAYNTDIDNIIKVDSNVFDITYITQENASNPSVIIEGRSYPTIPYDNLDSSATQSEEEGYVSGQVCAVGDINCTAEQSGIDITNLFTHPLQLLETLWGNITSFFAIITTFITILPPQLQTFLYVSFMLAVILGIIKIILN